MKWPYLLTEGEDIFLSGSGSCLSKYVGTQQNCKVYVVGSLWSIGNEQMAIVLETADGIVGLINHYK